MQSCLYKPHWANQRQYLRIGDVRMKAALAKVLTTGVLPKLFKTGSDCSLRLNYDLTVQWKLADRERKTDKLKVRQTGKDRWKKHVHICLCGKKKEKRGA